MKLLIIVPTEIHGVLYHRLIIPFNNLKGIKVTQVNNLDNLLDEILITFDAVYFSRTEGIFDHKAQIERLKRLKMPYIIDIDDYWELPNSHSLKNLYDKHDAPTIIKDLMRSACLVTTTHEMFADIIRKVNPNVAVLPNAIDDFQPQFKPSLNVGNKVRFGWIGAIHHFEDLQMIKPCLSKLNDVNCEIVLGGWRNNLHFNLFEDWFSNYGTNPNYKRLEASDVFNYGFMYDQIDVALIPLKENKFNSCKSNLKIIEAGFKKKAIIVSKVNPYLIDCNSKNSIQCTNSNDFYKAIVKLSKNPNLAIDLAEQLYIDVVNKYNIESVNVLRYNALNNINNFSKFVS